MSDDRFQTVERIFHDALAIPDLDRAAFIREACGGDDALRADVEALLDASATSADDAFLESPCESAARPIPALDADARLGPGTRIGRFTLVRLIGTGGMGAVYEAEQTQPRRRVALKVIRTGLSTAAALKRFAQEAEILARLTHPGIAQVYEVGTHDDGTGPLPWFAMELIDGARDLRRYADEETLDVAARLELFKAICDAVEYGHRSGVVHRDLKPENILVDRAGRPKIIDFGVARATDGDIAATTIETRAGQIVGTLHYMSPEQWRADPTAIDARADVYALGAVLFELLSGALPHDLTAAAIHEAGRIVMDEPPRRPSTVDRSLAGDIETIILKSLEKERERRYGSAAALAADIDRYLRREPIEARPPSTWYQLRLFARRNRTLVTAVAVTFVILVAATILSTVFAVRAHEAEQDAIDLANQEKAARRETSDLLTKSRDLTRWVIEDFAQQVADIPGGTRAEQQLTERVLDYLNGVTVTGAADPAFRREIGRGYLRLGEVLGNPYRDNVGQSGRALDAYRRGLSIFEAIASSDARTVQDDWNRATAHRLIGHLEEASGDVEAAAASSRRALAITRALVDEADAKARPLIEDDIATLESELAWRLREAGDLDASKRLFLSVLASRRDALAGDPSNASLRRSVALAEAGTATILGDVGELDAALEHADALLALVRDAGERPDHVAGVQARRDLATAYNKTGDVYTLRGHLDRAKACYDEALRIREGLAQSNPDSVLAQTDLAVSLSRVADIVEAKRQHRDALPLRERCHRLIADALEAQPEHRLLRRRYWITANKLATAHFLLRDNANAERFATRGLEVARTLVDEKSGHVQDLQGIAEALNTLGSICTMQTDTPPGGKDPFERAIDRYREAEAVWTRIESIGELSTDQKRSREANRKTLKLVEDAVAQMKANRDGK